MKSIRCWLAAAGSLLLLSSLSAQEFRQSTPQPQRWTAQPTTITPTTLAEVPDSAFPALVSRAPGNLDDPSVKTSTGKLAGPAVTITSSLAVVLGLFAAMVWMTRRFGSRGMNQGALPREILESLGTTSIDPRTRVTMLRCGNRILVVALTATGVHPLAEISDPEEVRQLTATCLGDAKRSFVSTLQSIENEPVPPGFVASTDRPATPHRRSRLFATA